MELTDELDIVLGESLCVAVLVLELKDKSDPDDDDEVVEEVVEVRAAVVTDREEFIAASWVGIRSTLNEEGRLYCL